MLNNNELKGPIVYRFFLNALFSTLFLNIANYLNSFVLIYLTGDF